LDNLKLNNMAKFNKPTTKKTTEKPVCQECLNSSKDKKLYFWVEKDDHFFLSCIDCINKFDYEISKPYHEPVKRKTKKDI